MEHEIRFYLKQIKSAIADENSKFKPSYLVAAIKLPTGAIELSVNTKDIEEKIDEILEAYDEDMCLKTNREIVMQTIMIA